MRRNLLLFSLFFSFSSSAFHANDYLKIIQKNLDTQPPLCLGLTLWPVSINKSDINSSYINAKMEALVDAGLLSSKISLRKKSWDLSKLGAKEFLKAGDFCYGKMKVKALESVQLADASTGIVTFTYFIENVPLWAKGKSIRFAFTELDNLLSGVNTARYQATFIISPQNTLEIIGDPTQLDLFY